MSALSERTRLGLEILGAGAALGIASDALLRVTPWGLNALRRPPGSCAGGASP